MPERRPGQEKSKNLRENWQFASLVPFHVLSAASRRVRFKLSARKASIDVVAYPRRSTMQKPRRCCWPMIPDEPNDLPSELSCVLRIRNAQVIDRICI